MDPSITPKSIPSNVPSRKALFMNAGLILSLVVIEVVVVFLYWVLSYYETGLFPHFNLGGGLYDVWIFSILKGLAIFAATTAICCSYRFRIQKTRNFVFLLNYGFVSYISVKLIARLFWSAGPQPHPDCTVFWIFISVLTVYAVVLDKIFKLLFYRLLKLKIKQQQFSKLRRKQNRGSNSISSSEASECEPLFDFIGEKDNSYQKLYDDNNDNDNDDDNDDDNDEEEVVDVVSNHSESVKFLLGLALRDKRLYAFAFLFLLIAATAQAYIPYITGKMVKMAMNSGGEEFHNYAGYLILASIICAVFSGLRGSIFIVCIASLNVRLREVLFESLLRQEVGFYDSAKIGDITSRLNTDTTKVADTIGLNVNVFTRSVVQSGGVLFFMFYLSWELTLATAIILPIITVLSQKFSGIYRKISEGTQEKLGDANSIATETLSSIITVRSFAGEYIELAQYSQELLKFYVYTKKKAVLYSVYCSVLIFLPNFVTAVVLFYGGKLVIEHKLEESDLVSFILYLQTLSSAISSIADVFTGFMEALGAADKVLSLINREPEIPLSGHISVPKEQFKGEIQLRDIVFKYPARPEVTIMDGLDLDIAPGEILALVGPSGGGKSSVINMVEHFYEQSNGTILLDGQPLREYDHEFIKSKISIVGQEPVLFARTIEQNILYGLVEEVHDALTNYQMVRSILKGDFMTHSQGKKRIENVLFNYGSLNAESNQTSGGYQSGPSEMAAVVTQEGGKIYTREDVIKAAKLANAHDFIMSMPNGYDTEVGEKGVQLSGGQKQRIAIARALVRNPDILLLDEATSALDTESEAIVQKAIDEIMQKKMCTVIVIAHRLSTIKNADRIVVIENGGVVESGKHDQLLALDGVYTKLVKRQMNKKH